MMKNLFVVALLLSLCGCASFNTQQVDISNEQTGLRSITTKTRAFTLWNAKAELAKIKTRQTDTTQLLEIGSINQEVSSTNVASQLDAVANLLRAIRPTP